MKSAKAMAVLKPYLVSGPMENGDWDARCPLHEDTKRSARINFETGQWICFAGCGKGRLSGLLRRMRERGVEAPRERSARSGPSASALSKEVDRWHRALLADETVRIDGLWRLRGIDSATIDRFNLGWDSSQQAFTIPIYGEDGELFNVRKYRPNAPADRKIWWAVKEPRPKPLYPVSVLGGSDWVVLTEGEMDALLAIQNGFPAVTGLAGAGTWQVNWSSGFQGKTVFIAYDRDTTGARGARQVAESLEPYARMIYITTIPLDKKGADVSDFFLEPHDADDFKKVLRSSEVYTKRDTDPTALDPIRVSVLDSFDAGNVGRALEMEVLISGRGQQSFTIPKVVVSTCTMDKGAICKFCPMMEREGSYSYDVPPWNEAVLEMVGHARAVRQDALRRTIGVPVKCERLTHDIQSYQTVEQLYVRPSFEEESGDFTPRRVYSVGKHDTMPSQVVRVTGTTWPDPDAHKNEFLAWQVSEAESALDEFRVSPEMVTSLKVFRPAANETPLRKLWEIGADLERHVTRIYGRRELHMAISLVYHSVLSFPFGGELEPRGWLDALIIGDTRTGKSKAAAAIADHYRAGFLINCEAATFAGIVGGLQQMGGSREWAVSWGAVPMNDRRLVILDEVSGLSHENIQQMSDVRSRGFVRLQKIAQEQAWARTRLLWLSNPREHSMEDYTHGIDAIEPLVGNREDIARFDFAMTLSSKDVTLDTIQQPPRIDPPTYAAEDCHNLVLWAWSRRPEDIEWEPGAEADVLLSADWLSERYVPDPPLLQGANARIKLARIAAALAASTFSSDSSGRHLIIRRQHVRDALRFLDGIYQHESFGYYLLSRREIDRAQRAEEHKAEARRFLLEDALLLDVLRSVRGGFTRETLEMSMNLDRSEANGKVNRLFELGMVNPNGRFIYMTPMMHDLLRQIEREESM